MPNGCDKSSVKMIVSFKERKNRKIYIWCENCNPLEKNWQRIETLSMCWSEKRENSENCDSRLT
jgi:hypothetical protein